MEEYTRLLDKHKNIKFHKLSIGEGVKGFIYLSKKGNYHIFISDSLSEKATARVIAHEIYHIEHDIPKMPYIIGIDSEHMGFERRARIFSSDLAGLISAFIKDERTTFSQ